MGDRVVDGWMDGWMERREGWRGQGGAGASPHTVNRTYIKLIKIKNKK